jgi:hypothetical protein
MINLRAFTITLNRTFLDWFDKPRVDQSVNTNLLTPPCNHTVLSHNISCPYPTWNAVKRNLRVNEYPGKDSRDFFQGKVVYGKILNIHKSKFSFDFGRAVQVVVSNLAAHSILTWKVDLIG